MSAARAELWWLPVGAGGHVVVHTSRWWELVRARREHRHPRPLFHAALEVIADAHRTVIEMTPAWGQPADASGVVREGPVGLRPLGRWRLFRYEVRAWPDGAIPDRAYAVDSPTAIPLTPAARDALFASLAEVPPLTWGRPVVPGGDMWNSNAVISWLLTRAGVDATRLSPPRGGSAPGWSAGIALGAD